MTETKPPAADTDLEKIAWGSTEYWQLVREKAYANWEERTRNGQEGDEASDWLKAEMEVDALLADYNRRRK